MRGDPAGYGGRGLSYVGIDFSVLRDKTIVLDPGHGGALSGAVGSGGLTEKEVNLAVALILRNLLAGYGANVVMTRQTDIDLLPEGVSGPVQADLSARVDSANSREYAVIFLSIHHNSLGVPNSRYNATETYYKMGDEGPSLDLARFLHRRLMSNVGVKRQALLPGNYYVLRNNRQPAVLGEASYLSHRGVERKLQGEAARQVEAYSYLLGIVDYLSGGIPVIENMQVPGSRPLQDPYPQVAARIYDESTGLGIDPQQLEMTMDGASLPVSYDQSTGIARARAVQPLANGTHRAAVRVRNLKGNAARETAVVFKLAVPPAHIVIVSSLERLPLDGLTPVNLTALVSDLWGRPVSDSTEVLFEFSDPNLATCTVLSAGGKGSVVVTPVANRPLEVRASSSDVLAQLTLPVAQPQESLVVIRTESGGGTLGGVKVNIAEAGLYATGEDGILTLEGLGEGVCNVSFERNGYRPVTRQIKVENGKSTIQNVRLEALMGGALLGRKVVIDPQGGLDEPGEIGSSGTREEDVNFAVASLLGDYLARAGALVLLTRSAEESPGMWERVARTEDFGGEVLVSVAHNGRPVKKISPHTVVNHYPSSTEGASCARLIASSLKGFAGRPYFGASAGYQRIIQQVSCPAVWVRAASVADPAVESMLGNPVILRQEAYAIFSGLARYFGWEPQGANPYLTGRLSDSRGGTISGALLVLDGWCPTQSDHEGRFLFQDLENSPHRIEVFYGGRTYGPYQAEPGRKLELLLGAQ